MKRRIVAVLAALVFTLACSGNAVAQVVPSVTTDHADYPPGSIVSISGTGFQPGETVRLQILRIDLPANDGPEHLPWEVNANSEGGLTASWLVTPDELGATLQLTATGLSSGLTAQTIFTDGVITPASGGGAIPADTAGGTYTALTGPILAETIVGDISLGTVVLTAPAGFVFDTNPPLPVITLEGDANHKNINGLANGDTIALTISPTSLGFTVTTKSRGQTRNVLTYSNIRVRPTAASPLASGNITHTGTSVFPGSTGNFGTLTEVVGAAARLAVSGFPSPQTAGVTGSVTVTVQDQFGNTIPTYTGTIHFTSSDSQATLPADYSFLSADNGTHSFNGGVTLKTLGTQSITASDVAAASLTGTQAGISINAASADRLAFSVQPGSAVYGSPLNPQPTITTRDRFGNNSTVGLGASKMVSLTLGGGSGSLTGTTALDIGTGAGNGTVTFANLRINTAGVGKQLTTSATGFISATSDTFAVVPAQLVVAANNATRAYGEANPSFTAAIAGFVNGENTNVLSGALVLSTAAHSGSLPGDYPIVPSGLLAANYSIGFSNGTLTVTGTNQPPVLAAFTNVTLLPGQLLSVRVYASDPNGDRLSFSLDPGAPEGALVTNLVTRFPQPATNTIFRWRPTRGQSSTTNLITIRVTDDGLPPMSAAQTLTVVVQDYAEISLGSTNLQCGQTVAVPIYLASSDGVTNLDFSIRWPTAYLSNATLAAAAPAVASLSLQDQGASLKVSMRAAPGQVLGGTQPLALLSFEAITNDFSAFVQLPVENASAVKPNGSLYANYITHAAMIAVVEGQPLLWASLSTNVTRNLTLYGRLGTSYQLQSSADLAAPSAWGLAWSYVQTNGAINLNVDSLPPVIFYRIFQP